MATGAGALLGVLPLPASADFGRSRVTARSLGSASG